MIFLKERIGKLIRELSKFVYLDPVPVTDYNYTIVKDALTEEQILDKSEWKTFGYAMECGGNDLYHYYGTSITVPDSFQGKTVVYRLETGGGSRWDTTNPQCRCYINGQFVQGLDENHESLILTDNAKGGEVYDITLRVYTGTHSFHSTLKSNLAVLDKQVEKYYYDLLVPYQVACLLNQEDTDYIHIINSLNESLNKIDLRTPGSTSFYTSLSEAQDYLEKEFYEKRCIDTQPKVYCVGHTHIDIAWLWTLEVAKDKAVRSFSTVLELMKQFPEYRFMSSQPHLYKAIKTREPKLYEEIKSRVKDGSWEADGSMFVEADCNLSSGEALVRQILVGKRFFQEEFQAENEILWLPDVFGYSAALPQIMQKSGIPYFMTTKISWNEFNKLPYDTFLWEGIDGSKVLTHFIPASDYDKNLVKQSHFTTYNGMLEASQIKGSWQRYQQKYLNDEVLMAFGYGDGGGGPTKEMLEHQRRLAKGIPGCPQTVMSTAKDFFHVLEEKVKDNKYLPEWSGELYLEYHRGTYTSMARNKRFNRKSEFLLQNLEGFAKLSELLTQKSYPKEELKEGWEVLLRNQFHDILPGSSIKEVYEVSKGEYEDLLASGHKLLDSTLGDMVDHIAAPRHSIVVFNPNGLELSQMVEFKLPDDSINGKDGSEAFNAPMAVTDGVNLYPCQKTYENTYMFYADKIPPKGYKSYSLVKESLSLDSEVVITKERMENQFYIIQLNKKGQFISIYDKAAKREVLQEGSAANVLMTYEDKPHNWDAWDVNNYYIEKSWEIDDVQNIEVIEEGGLRSCLKIVRNYLSSTITQYIYIYKDIPRIDVKNVIDWKEHHIFMKALFPVDIHTAEATFDIQYGNVKRATHYNTSWDYARFEVCHHKWLDVSEDDYGVSLLNDCKYGCNVHNGVIGLSLLKSATSPNPDADKEIHEFTYSIYPHQGDWKAAGTVKQAYGLNNPFIAKVKENDSGNLPVSYCLVNQNADNVVIEVMKDCEDEKATVIRLYECYNRRTEVELNFSRDIADIMECNLLETEISPVTFDHTEAQFTIMPYEIKTFKIFFK